MKGFTPDYDVLLGGSSIKGNIKGRLEELTVTDQAGLESDSCTLTIDNAGFEVASPRTGVLLQVKLGYRESGLVDMGLFTVADVTTEFSPRMIVIQAHAAEMKESFKEPKTRPFEKKTIGDIVNQIAGEHGLQAAVGQELSSRLIPYLGQTEESDMHLLQRLARHHGAILKPTNGRLVFTSKGNGQTASGGAMGHITITPPMVVGGSITKKGRPEHTEAKGHWHDRNKGERKTETASGGKTGPSYLTRHDLPSKDEAKWWAQARATSLKQQEKTLTAELYGDPYLTAELVVTTQGLSPDDDTFTLTSAEHSFTPSGYLTSIDGELKA